VPSAPKSFLDRLYGKLSRETSSGRFIPQVDGLRFVAIGMVVLYHLDGYISVKSAFYHFHGHAGPDWSAALAAQGFNGVELFFAISGFILGLPFAAHYLQGAPAVSLKKYYLRRVTRLEPPYLLAVLGLFGLAVVIQGKSVASLGPHLLVSMFYLHNLIYGLGSSVIGVAWSLEVEVQFYLLVPLLALVFRVRERWLRRSILCALIIGTLVAQQIWMHGSLRGRISILAFLQFFLTGFLLADIFQDEWHASPRTSLYWDLIALAGWPALFVVVLPSLRLWHWMFPCMVLVLYAAAFRGRFCSRLLSLRVATVIGGMCYSIYLIHYEVISAVARFTVRTGEGLPYCVYLAVQMAIVGAAVLLVCGGYFVLIEKPCMRRDWPQRLHARCREWLAAFEDERLSGIPTTSPARES
jgi:peptidoglycan/LPS O-acetylase OafA/YrhL